MKIKVPSVTVAVCAYNEEENILKLLMSVLTQKEEGFELKEIWVYDDGSTDSTSKRAKSLKSKKIKVFRFSKRIGKSSRLNSIYRKLNTEILVQTDSDVKLPHEFVIRDIIRPLLLSGKVAMCGGNPVPEKAETFTEKAVNCSFIVYEKFRSEVRGGNNIFSVDGRLLAYKKELVKRIKVPSDMIANDVFTYFVCLSEGYKYRYVKGAKVFFKSPKNLPDQIRQNTRFEAAEMRMEKYFSRELVRRECSIPKGLLIKNMFNQLVKHPVLSLYIFLINQYCRFIAKQEERRLTAKWPIALTTKKLA